jgi:hypothetical protein
MAAKFVRMFFKQYTLFSVKGILSLCIATQMVIPYIHRYGCISLYAKACMLISSYSFAKLAHHHNLQVICPFSTPSVKVRSAYIPLN